MSWPEQSFELCELTSIEARLEAFDWPFPRERREAIARNWAKLSASKPSMFDGRVLLQHRGDIADGVFHAAYFETDYSAFVARKAHVEGWDEGKIRNGFAMAALAANDGAYLLGVMAQHNFNGGQIYFAAGTPDPSDVTPDGRVDLSGSALRELKEETGLRSDEVEAASGWTAVMGSELIAFMRKVIIDLPAVAARDLILRRIGEQSQPELQDIFIARRLVDIRPDRMPPYMQAYLRSVLAA